MPTGNIYLTPNWVESQRAKGYKDDVIAEYLATKDPAFGQKFRTVRTDSQGDPRAYTALLDYTLYNTTNPTERFDPSAVQRQDQANEQRMDEEIGAQPEGFIEESADALRKRGERLREGIDRRAEEGAPLIEKVSDTVVQAGAETIGGAFDVGFEGLEAGFEALPDMIKEPIKEGASNVGEALANTKAGQAIMGALGKAAEVYDQLKETNPEVADNLRAAFEFASIIPTIRGAKGVKQASGTMRKTIGGAGDILEESAEASIKKGRKGFIEELVQKPQTMKVKEAQVPRSTETGKVFKKTTIVPDADEKRAARAIFDIQGVSEKNSFQQNYTAVQKANQAEAKTLKKTLAKPGNNAAVPKKELKSRLSNAAKELAEDPTLTGDAEKTAEKMLNKANQIIDEMNGDVSGTLKGRKKFDKWLESQKAKAFDQKTENAFEKAKNAIRREWNDFLDEKAVNVEVKQSLRRQSGMYTAMDTIGKKAAKEADDVIGRLMQRVDKLLGTKNKAVQVMAAAAGVGGLGAAATFAPMVLYGGIAIGTGVEGIRLMLKPALRKNAGRALNVIKKAIPEAAEKEAVMTLKQTATMLEKLIEGTTVIELERAISLPDGSSEEQTE